MFAAATAAGMWASQASSGARRCLMWAQKMIRGINISTRLRNAWVHAESQTRNFISTQYSRIVNVFSRNGSAASTGGSTSGNLSFSQGQLQHFQRILQKDGVQALIKSKETLTQRLNEHIIKLEEITKAGGHTSSVEREIQNFASQIEAIEHLLRG